MICVPNSIRYKLFNVYACDYNGELLHSIDDQLDLLTDYGILPKFISKEDAVNSYIRIADRRNDCSKIATANLLEFSFYTSLTYSYEGFIESLCRVALIVFANPSLQGLYESTGMKIAMFLELWNLGDEKNLTIHREERKNLKQSKKNIVY